MIARSETLNPLLSAVDASSPVTLPAAGAVAGDVVPACVARAQAGDVEAFAELVGLFETRVFHFVLRMVRHAHDAEDVTQETFLKAWKHLHRFRAGNAFATWLFTIARRTALNHIRSRRPTQELGDHDEPVEQNPAGSAMGQERADEVWRVARRLKPDQYEALWLRYVEGLSVQETARVMATNAIRVRVLLHRGRKRMADLLAHKQLLTGGDE